MRIKIVPPARGLDTLRAVHRAVPLVPEEVEDCCTRLTRRTAVSARDEAREWLTFLRALGLVEEAAAGYRRLRTDHDRATLAVAFRESVYGADEILSVLEATDEPLPLDAVYKRVTLPAWERQRHPDPASVWRTRVERLLDWAVDLELAAHSPSGYQA